MDLYINYNFYSRGKESKKEYESWWRSANYTFDSITSSQDSMFRQELITVKFEPKENDILYFVWVEYSSGDSFGNSEGNMVEVGVYNTRANAQDIVSKIQEDYKKSKDDFTTLQDIEGFSLSTSPWKGYFENLTQVHIEELIYEDNSEEY